MPKRPAKPCPGAGKYKGRCANLIRTGNPVCNRCLPYHIQATREKAREHNRGAKREYDKNRGTRQERGYNESHYRLKKMIFNDEGGLCRFCKEKNILKPAEELHHADGNSWNRERENLIPLCKSCHSSHHAWGKK